MLELFTKADCPVCIQTKAFLTEKKVEFVEYLIGQDIMREDVIVKFPQAKVVPIIIVNGYQIAGLSELKNIIENDQLGVI